MGETQKKSTAFAYLRTSSAANIGDDKDSQQRQAARTVGGAKHSDQGRRWLDRIAARCFANKV